MPATKRITREHKSAKNTFSMSKIDPPIAAFAEEILDKKLLLKLKKSKYVKDKNFVKHVDLLENNAFFEQNLDVKGTDFVEKKEIGRSILYSFDAPFCLFHADIGNLEFLGKNHRKYIQ